MLSIKNMSSQLDDDDDECRREVEFRLLGAVDIKSPLGGWRKPVHTGGSVFENPKGGIAAKVNLGAQLRHGAQEAEPLIQALVPLPASFR